MQSYSAYQSAHLYHPLWFEKASGVTIMKWVLPATLDMSVVNCRLFRESSKWEPYFIFTEGKTW